MMGSPDPRDLKRAADMLAWARKALALAEGLDEVAFRRSELHQTALAHCIAIVGEAAYKTSDAFRAQHPQIPWRVIIGMRHKLIHDYGGIALHVVWLTVAEDLPVLVGLLQPIVPPGALNADQ
jgi:uncharacterized protein with HEPN domain